MDRRGHERIALVAMHPRNEFRRTQFHNYGVRRVEAALRAADDGRDVRVFELAPPDVVAPDLDALVSELVDFDPDLVGFSAYIWSFAALIEVARRLRARGGERTLVFGGPAAHPNMFALSTLAGGAQVLDALALGAGEETICALAASTPGDRAAMRAIPGLALPNDDSRLLPLHDRAPFVETEKRATTLALDRTPSPYQMRRMPTGGFGYLQTFQGCPLSCTYCEWGTQEDPRNVLSVASLERELRALREAEVEGVLLIDAALNLNPAAFSNLARAERSVGLFRDRTFLCELYPVLLTDAHLEFLGGMGDAHCQIGLQSFDPQVLEALDRPFDERRFEQALRSVGKVAGVTVEIIFGLPGDNPESFRRTFERLRELPCRIRVYHCVVLPSALMARAPASFALRFDHATLKVTSCLGWTEDAIANAREWLTRLAIEERGQANDFWWDFPSPSQRADDRRVQPEVRAPQPGVRRTG